MSTYTVVLGLLVGIFGVLITIAAICAIYFNGNLTAGIPLGIFGILLIGACVWAIIWECRS